MSAIGGAGRAANVPGVGASSVGGSPAPAAESSAGAASISRGAAPSGRSGVMARITAATASPASSEAAFAAHTAGLPRTYDEYAEITFGTIRRYLEEGFQNWETDDALDMLGRCSGPQWLAVMDRLASTPDTHGKPLLEEFVDKGLEDRNKFLATFVRQANVKLGLGIPDGSDREMRRVGRHVLEHYGSDAHTDLGGVIRTAAEGTVDGARGLLGLILYGVGFRPDFNK